MRIFSTGFLIGYQQHAAEVVIFSTCISIYIHIDISLHICARVKKFTSASTQACKVHTPKLVYIHTRLHTYIYVHTYIQIYSYACTHMHIVTHIFFHISQHTHVHIHQHNNFTHTHTNTHTHTHRHTHTHIYIHIHIYTHTHTHK